RNSIQKGGSRASQRLIPSLARDTAPFIYWALACHCPRRHASPRSSILIPATSASLVVGPDTLQQCNTRSLGTKVCYGIRSLSSKRLDWTASGSTEGAVMKAARG